MNETSRYDSNFSLHLELQAKHLMAILTLFISGTNVSQSERRFDNDIQIQRLKEKLEVITGVSSQSMRLELFNERDESLGEVLGDVQTLSYFLVKDYFRLHVS